MPERYHSERCAREHACTSLKRQGRAGVYSGVLLGAMQPAPTGKTKCLDTDTRAQAGLEQICIERAQLLEFLNWLIFGRVRPPMMSLLRAAWRRKSGIVLILAPVVLSPLLLFGYDQQVHTAHKRSFYAALSCREFAALTW